MRLAPTPALSGCVVPMAAGLPGVYQTIGAMRALVTQYRTHPAIRQAATSAAFLTPERDEFAECSALFAWVRDSVRYVRDVHNVETLTTPDKTMAGLIGDCDDQATLLAALFESIGYPTRFVIAGYHYPGEFEHVYVQVYACDQWIDCDPTEHRPFGWSPPDPVCLAFEAV